MDVSSLTASGGCGAGPPQGMDQGTAVPGLVTEAEFEI